jgi:hypothetical protein
MNATTTTPEAAMITRKTSEKTSAKTRAKNSQRNSAPMAIARNEHRWIARGLLQGRTESELLEQAAKAAERQDLRITPQKIHRVARQFAAAGITPEGRLLTVSQAAVVLGVIGRRVRLLCQEGRLGTQVGGGPWIIATSEMRAYLGRPHSSGQAGRGPAERDKAVVAKRYSLPLAESGITTADAVQEAT